MGHELRADGADEFSGLIEEFPFLVAVAALVDSVGQVEHCVEVVARVVGCGRLDAAAPVDDDPGGCVRKVQRSLFAAAVRFRTRRRRRSTSGFTSRAGPARLARGRPGSRSAARVTASASIGSDLPRSRAERRAPAISRVCVHTTAWPASSRSASNRRVRRRQSSMASRTWPNWLIHLVACW